MRRRRADKAAAGLIGPLKEIAAGERRSLNGTIVRGLLTLRRKLEAKGVAALGS
jgi:hypothetical protein